MFAGVVAKSGSVCHAENLTADHLEITKTGIGATDEKHPGAVGVLLGMA